MKKHIVKVGVALSGGGALGIAHIGVLQSLQKHHIQIDCIAGTSAGALVASCFAFGVPLEDMVARAQTLKWAQISKFSFSRMGFASINPIKKLVEELVGDVRIEDAHIPLAIVATDIQSGKPVVFREGSLVHAITASVCIPGVFVPVHEKNGRQLVDGGVSDNLPIGALADMGARIKIGVNLFHWHTYKKPKHVLDVIFNVMEIMTHRQTSAHAKQADVLIEPNLAEYGWEDFKKADALIAEGLRVTDKAMPLIEGMVEKESQGILLRILRSMTQRKKEILFSMFGVILFAFLVFLASFFFQIERKEVVVPQAVMATSSTVQQIQKELPVVLVSPHAGDIVHSPLVVSGKARGTWFFEGSFPIVLTDWNGRIIAQGIAQAEGEWMTEDFVPFSGTLTFTPPQNTGDFSQKGTLILKKDNPSDLPEHDGAVETSVRFW